MIIEIVSLFQSQILEKRVKNDSFIYSQCLNHWLVTTKINEIQQTF